jgi:stage II sporulation protein D
MGPDPGPAHPDAPAPDPTPDASTEHAGHARAPAWAGFHSPPPDAAVLATPRQRRRTRLLATTLAGIATVLVGAVLLSCQMLGGPSTPPARAPVPADPQIARRGDVAAAGEPDIRVRIVRSAEKAAVAGPASITVRSAARGTVWTLRTPVAVAGGATGLTLTDADGQPAAMAYGDSAIVEVAPSPREQPKELTLDGVEHHGRLLLVHRSDDAAGRFDVIAEMPIEQYLPGVLTSELFRTWPLAAFQAQAVAARSYAMHERERARIAGRPFDVESTTRDQAYGGRSELPVALEATRTTRGKVLWWQGGVLRAYYSSTAGGRAASAADTWPTGTGFEYNLAGPIQAGPRPFADEKSPVYRWERTMTAARLRARLKRWGEENGHGVKRVGEAVVAVEAADTNSVGRPRRYRVLDADGREFTLSAEELRVACNWPVPGIPDVTFRDRVLSGDMELSFTGADVTIRGRGFGHGVGLCQYSAAGLAAQGKPWDEIVRGFYPGAEIRTIW